jgi:hypothetical protein
MCRQVWLHEKAGPFTGTGLGFCASSSGRGLAGLQSVEHLGLHPAGTRADVRVTARISVCVWFTAMRALYP